MPHGPLCLSFLPSLPLLPLCFPFSPSPKGSDSYEPPDADGSGPDTYQYPGRRRSSIMDTARAEMNLNFSFRLQIFRIELNLVLLLLPSGLHIERIAEIVVVQMKRRRIVPISVGPHGLTVGDSRVLDQNFNIGYSFSVRSADKPLDRKTMIRLVGGKQQGRTSEQNYGTGYEEDRTPPRAGRPCPLARHSFVPVPLFRQTTSQTAGTTTSAHWWPGRF